MRGAATLMADKSPQMVTLMYRRVSGLSLVSGEDGEALQWQYHGHRHGCFVFSWRMICVFLAQLVANRETSDVVAFSKGSFMPLRGEITRKSISFGLVLYIKGSKWSCLFNYKIGDGCSWMWCQKIGGNWYILSILIRRVQKILFYFMS